MPFKLSRCINLRHPAQEQVAEFYRKVLGFEVDGKVGQAFEMNTDPIRFFVDKAESRELVLELLVPDLDKARDELVAAGCQVICWEGKGQDCYVRDPFGTTYNLWEEPDAFK
ncbi:MAG: VOC family protein [FCB group bacterium]|nr:VOC family protein [FCB group bacterium]